MLGRLHLIVKNKEKWLKKKVLKRRMEPCSIAVTETVCYYLT